MSFSANDGPTWTYIYSEAVVIQFIHLSIHNHLKFNGSSELGSEVQIALL